MVGHRMLSFINLRFQQINCTTKIFEGLSIIAVGDILQLKPVFDGWIFENLTEDYGPLAMNLWTDLFQVYHLIQIMRQKDSADFAKLLNRLRRGNHSKSDIDTLNTRMNHPIKCYASKLPTSSLAYIFSSPEPLGSQGELIGWP